MIQSTSGMSIPRAATSVQNRTPARAQRNQRENTLRLSEIFHGFYALLLHHAAVEGAQLDAVENVEREKGRGQEIDLGAGQKEHDYFFLRMNANEPKQLESSRR